MTNNKFYDIAIVDDMGNEMNISVISEWHWLNFIANCHDVIPLITVQLWVE